MTARPRTCANVDPPPPPAAGSPSSRSLAGGVGGWAATTELVRRGDRAGRRRRRHQRQEGAAPDRRRRRRAARPRRRPGARPATSSIRLDETVTRANLPIVSKQLDELRARQARLEAERDGANGRINFPETLIASEAISRRRRSAWRRAQPVRGPPQAAATGRSASSASASPSCKEEIHGLDDAEPPPRRKQIELINQELEGVRELWQQEPRADHRA